MRSLESLNIEYLIYKLELLVDNFKRSNQTKYVKNLNKAKGELSLILNKINNGAKFKSPEIQEEMLNVSKLIIKVIDKVNKDEIKQISILDL